MSKSFTETEKRRFEKIKKLTLEVVQKMDNPKMLNYKRYKDMFDVFEKDPDAFRNWDVLNRDDLDSTIQLLQLPFEEVRMPQIKAAADILNMPLEEYIYYRQDDPRGVRSKQRVPTGLTY